MSIILKALKKAEKEEVGGIEKAVSIPIPSSNDSKKKSRSIIFYASLGVLFVASIVAANVITQALADILKGSSAKPSIGKELTASKTHLPVTQPVDVVVLREETELPDFELSGIMMGFPPQALIDGYFFEVGDQHLGMDILRIEPDHIIVSYKGKEFKKRLK